MKHKRTKHKMNDKQALTIIISLACAAALLIGALVVIGPILGGNPTDPHAGHNHGSDLGDGHYEGDGHDHGTPTSGTTNAKVKYQIYSNADKTYRLVIRDQKGTIVFEADKLSRAPSKEAVDATAGIYELSWATDNGPNDFECVYYNEKTGQVSKKFVAPRGTDGVRIAYGSDDQTKMIVQELFNDKGYYKEYALKNAAPNKNGDIIVGGKLQADKKTVVVSYLATGTDATQHITIKLYE